MRTCSRRLVLAAIAAVVALFVITVPAVALAKSYEIADLKVTAAFDSAGDLSIDELRTFDFSGSFHWVEWQLATKGSDGIEVQAVADGATGAALTRVDGEAVDPGTYSVTDSGSEVVVHVAIDQADTQYPVRLTYVAKGAVKRYSDSADLYWQFVGDGWSVPTRHASVTIAPPTTLTKADVRAWAHGPLTGVVSIADNGAVTLAVDNVPASTFIEAHVLYPASVVAAAPLAGGAHRNSVLADEGALANEANRQRSQARLQYWGFLALVVIASLGALAFSIWAFVRYGREYKPEFPGGYLREDPRPDLHPAVIGALMRMGDAQDSDISATLLQLADTHVITMQPVTVQSPGIGSLFGATKETYELARVPGAEVTHPLDTQLLGLLFDDAGDGTKVDLVGLKEYAKAHPKTFTEAMADWKKAAGTEAQTLGFVETESVTWQVFVAIASVVAAGAGIWAGVVLESAIPFLIGIPTAIVCGIIAGVMRRRSRKGNELFAQYKALKQFLLDFSRLNEAPPASVILWNRFLVLAVVFGVADQVIKQLQVVLPQVVQDPTFATTYWWLYGGFGHASPMSEVQSSFVSAAQVATSQMSSASGMGGGFSGGGGFGGGGGGGGAG